MEQKENLDPREKAGQTIGHLLNDFGEYPDVWLTDEEKIDKENRRLSDPEFGERYSKWQHNKYSVTWWFSIVIPNLDLIINQFTSGENRTDLLKKLFDLRIRVGKEATSKITKETVTEANNLLEETKKVL